MNEMQKKTLADIYKRDLGEGGKVTILSIGYTAHDKSHEAGRDIRALSQRGLIYLNEERDLMIAGRRDERYGNAIIMIHYETITLSPEGIKYVETELN